MSEVFGQADELGPARVIQVQDLSLDLKAVLVLDNVAHGPAIGGLRIAPDVSVEECSRLARAMTLKSSATNGKLGTDHDFEWKIGDRPRFCGKRGVDHHSRHTENVVCPLFTGPGPLFTGRGLTVDPFLRSGACPC